MNPALPTAPFNPSFGQATPAPCTNCGAPMSFTEATSLHHTPELSCRYCGHREALPADAAERHRHLRLRLAQLGRLREASEAPLQTFKMMNQQWPLAIVISLAMGVYQTQSFVGTWRLLGHANPMQAAFGAIPLAVSVGMLVGWLGMRSTFARLLKPLLRARPPQHPGLPARCRNCGGDLPPVRAPEVTCGFCSASNLLDDSLTRDASALLAAEAAEYERRMRPWARDANVFLAPSRAFYRYFIVGGVAALLVVGLAFGSLLAS